MDKQRKHEYRRQINAHLANGETKAESIRQVATYFPELRRNDAIDIYSLDAFTMSSVQASTYFYGYHVPQLETPTIEGVDNEPLPFEIETTTVSDSLRVTSEQAANWYLERTHETDRDVFLQRGGINDNSRGAIYSYHNASATCYVGITGYSVKSRLTTPTSPHAQKPWWKDWTYMRFLPLEAGVDRQILEYLLILGLKPTANQKPQAINFQTFLSQY